MDRSIARWVLLSALLLGVVGMHHLTDHPTSTGHPGSHAMHTTEPAALTVDTEVPKEPVPAHDLLHLCLAVLGAALGLGMLWLVLGTAVTTAPARRSSGVVVALAPRAPPPGRLLLTLCVSRR
ncbi:DUF6153 family protein [Actinokineospora cianjurensis]|uniref:Uncharacterized protein n=1 Tax=Actinokineospora cianjurensis TaxID=585224 RepID=A0A421B1Q4_9PSEU|nr:DUF6153 family protein [Actinokineospora cianjurensis]RLK58324.1 hypothetical protein CLV68_4421 [Actinokineospora cianjurensis]